MSAPKLNVQVSAELRATNGTFIRIDQSQVLLSKPGPRGGDGHSVVVPLGEWDTINEAVTSVRTALRRADDLRRDLEEAPFE